MFLGFTLMMTEPTQMWAFNCNICGNLDHFDGISFHLRFYLNVHPNYFIETFV